MNKMYLVVECTALNDQWECDCNREPLLIATKEDDIEEYKNKYGYEIYETNSDGYFSKIKDYDEGDLDSDDYYEEYVLCGEAE